MPRVRPLPTSEGNPRSGESPNKYSLIRNVQTISRRYYYTSDRRPSRAHDGSVQPRPKSSPPNPGWYRHKLLCPDVYIIALCATQCQPGCENFWNEAVLVQCLMTLEVNFAPPPHSYPRKILSPISGLGKWKALPYTSHIIRENRPLQYTPDMNCIIYTKPLA